MISMRTNFYTVEINAGCIDDISQRPFTISRFEIFNDRAKNLFLSLSFPHPP